MHHNVISPYHPALHLRMAFFISVSVTVLQNTKSTVILPQHSAFIIIRHHNLVLHLWVFIFWKI